MVFDQLQSKEFNSASTLVLLANDAGTPAVDAIATAYAPSSAAGLRSNFNFGLSDSTATVFDSLDFPLLLDLANFDSRIITVDSALFDTDATTLLGSEFASFVITTLEPVSASAPAYTLIFVLFSSGALFFIRRKLSNESNFRYDK